MPGDKVIINGFTIEFPCTDLEISMADSKLWSPPPIPKTILTEIERKAIIHSLAKNVYYSRESQGLYTLLPLLGKFKSSKAKNRQIKNNTLLPNIHKITKQIKEGNFLALIKLIEPFIGYGNGLTPSGDDFISGILLALNRWANIFNLDPSLSGFNKHVVELCYKKTTTLSANLIESATESMADERLIKAVDYLAAGEYSSDEVQKGILSWGNSSGVDTLAGMMTAFSSLYA